LSVGREKTPEDLRGNFVRVRWLRLWRALALFAAEAAIVPVRTTRPMAATIAAPTVSVAPIPLARLAILAAFGVLRAFGSRFGARLRPILPMF
jgi:hypothetical protein